MVDNIWNSAGKQFAEIKCKIATMFDCNVSDELNEFVFDYIHSETVMKNVKEVNKGDID